jgi:uncharacterized protein (DUF169 family)
MITIADINRLGQNLESWLRMRVHPIAFKFVKNSHELPKGAIIPSRDIGKKVNLCQAFSMVQREGATMAMFLGDHWCFEPVIGLGFSERIPKFLSGYHRYPDSVRNMEAAARWCQNMPCLEKKDQIGLCMSPVHACTFMPDVIVMHINGMMASQMMVVKNWMDGGDINCQLSGHAGCVYAIVPAIKNQSCNIAIPCRGDRQVGLAQDDEIFFSLVPGMLPDFIAGINFLEQNGWGIPMRHFLKEEVEMRPKYMDMAELLGMEVRRGNSEGK